MGLFLAWFLFALLQGRWAHEIDFWLSGMDSPLSWSLLLGHIFASRSLSGTIWVSPLGLNCHQLPCGVGAFDGCRTSYMFGIIRTSLL